MMEYTNKYWNMPFIKKSLNKRYGKHIQSIDSKADAEYRDMLNRSDDIEGQSDGVQHV